MIVEPIITRISDYFRVSHRSGAKTLAVMIFLSDGLWVLYAVIAIILIAMILFGIPCLLRTEYVDAQMPDISTIHSRRYHRDLPPLYESISVNPLTVSGSRARSPRRSELQSPRTPATQGGSQSSRVTWGMEPSYYVPTRRGRPRRIEDYPSLRTDSTSVVYLED